MLYDTVSQTGDSTHGSTSKLLLAAEHVVEVLAIPAATVSADMQKWT
jgi:hypothetical protein